MRAKCYIEETIDRTVFRPVTHRDGPEHASGDCFSRHLRRQARLGVLINQANILKRRRPMKGKMPKDIDEYLERHSSEDQRLLRQMRATIHKAAPEAAEKISYGIPTFYLNGNLVHFAAFAHHIGFYPTASGIAGFKKQLAPFGSSKGAVQFPKDKRLPLTLVTKIVKFRVKENLHK